MKQQILGLNKNADLRYIKSFHGMSFILKVSSPVMAYYMRKGMPILGKMDKMYLVDVFATIEWMAQNIKIRRSLEDIFEDVKRDIMNSFKDNDEMRGELLMQLEKTYRQCKKKGFLWIPNRNEEET